MNRRNKRQGILVGLIGLLALIVVLDRAGVFRASADGDADTDPREAYAQRALLLDDEQSLVNAADQWAAAAAAADQQWGTVRSRIIVERTRELAEESLRERIRSEMDAIGLTMAAAVPVRGAGAEQSADLQTVEVRFEFDASDPSLAYQLMERVEHLEDLAAVVTRVEMVGPGIVQLPESVQTKLWIRSLALISAEAGS